MTSLASRSAFAHHATHLLRRPSLHPRPKKWICTSSTSAEDRRASFANSQLNTTRRDYRPRYAEQSGFRNRPSDDPREKRSDRRFRAPYRRDFSPDENGRNAEEDEKRTEIQQALASGDDLLYGINPVLLALQNGRRARFEMIYMQDKAAGERKRENEVAVSQILQLAVQREINVKKVDKGCLNSLSGNRPHQGIVLQAAPLEMNEMKSLPRAEQGAKPVWLVLDEVTDPQNAGALIRSAYFLGARGVALCRKNSTRITATVSKASAGAVEVFDVRMVGSLPRFLRKASEEGWVIVGMAGEGGREVREVEIDGPTVVVVGSEGNGLRTLVRNSCDELVRIGGGAQGVDSLNVSVAGGVALYELLKQGN